MSSKSDSDDEEYYSATDSDEELNDPVSYVTNTVVVVNGSATTQPQKSNEHTTIPNDSPKVTINVTHESSDSSSEKHSSPQPPTPNGHNNSSTTSQPHSHSILLTVTSSPADQNALQKQREKKLPPPPPAKSGHNRSFSVNDSQITSNLPGQRASLQLPSQKHLSVQEQNFRNSLPDTISSTPGSSLVRSTSAHAEMGLILHPPPQPVVEDPDIEFIVKNLDTGESFSSKHIDEFIPKGLDPKSLDPLSFDLWNRSNPGTQQTQSSSSSNTSSPATKHKRTKSIDEGKKLLSKLKHKVITKKDHKEKAAVHTTSHGTNNMNNNNHSNGATIPATLPTPQATSPAIPHSTHSHTSEKPQQLHPTAPSTTDKSSASKKKQLFAQLVRQHFVVPGGSIWVMRFNFDGTLLAVGGHDAIVRVFKVKEDPSSNDFLERDPVLLTGHGGDILSLSWSRSRSNLLLTGSMDSTVRLWNLSQILQGTQVKSEVFEHDDVITAVMFHPKIEELFITGCLDNRLRVWSTKGKIVSQTFANTGFVTSVAFTLDAERVITGSYDGKCTIFKTEVRRFMEGADMQGFDYVSEISTQRKKGKKVTGIEMMPDGKHFLVTSNDSCIRQYALSDFSLVSKYKGLKNENFQIFATPSDNGNYIICGSEDCNVFMWEANTHRSVNRLGSVNTKTFVHDSFQAHSKSVTATMFAPVSRRKTPYQEGQIIVTADLQGEIKVFENKQVVPHSL